MKRIGESLDTIRLIVVPSFFSLLLGASQLSCEFGPRAEPTPIPREMRANLLSSGLTPRRFSITGLAFFGQSLFVGSDRGLLEVVDGKLSRRLNWASSDDVIEEPYVDEVHNALWVRHSRLDKLIRFDGTQWEFASLPVLPATRGDRLQGFSMFNSKSELFIHSGSAIWSWDNSDKRWRSIEMPRLNCGGQEPGEPPRCFARASATAELLFIVVRVGTTATRPSVLTPTPHQGESDYIYYKNGEEWIEVPNPTGTFFFVKRIIGGGNKVYILTERSELFAATQDRITRLFPPSEPEALTLTSTGNLLVSVKGGHFLELDSGEWKKRSNAIERTYQPWDIVHLTERGGRIAYSASALEGVPSETCRLAAPSSLWTVEGGVVQCVNEPN